MPQIINTNIASLTAQRNLNSSQSANGTALERLSSGLRINSAKDDAAGLAISTKFESQVKGLNVAIRNAGDGISLAQTAEGALGAMTENLQRIRELAVQSSNATNSDDDRVALQAEVKQLMAEVTRTAEETNFNGRNLLDGSFEGTFQIGANAGNTVDVKIQELTAEKLGVSDTAGISAQGTDQALQNGDLIINGTTIDPSQSTSDTASTVNSGASAIAKVEAINAKSDDTGVTAVVSTNVAAGSEMTPAAETGTVTINDVEISISTGGSDASTDRDSVISAINARQDQTGVTAVDGGDAGGVILEAADGRNIEVSFGTDFGDGTGPLTDDEKAVAEAATGLKSGVSYGGFTLISKTGEDITIEGGSGTGTGDVANAGLSAGVYSGSVAAVTSTTRSSDIASTETKAVFTTADMNIAADTDVNATNNSFELSVNGGDFALLTLDSDFTPTSGTGVQGEYDDVDQLVEYINDAISNDTNFQDANGDPTVVASAALAADGVTQTGGIAFTTVEKGEDASIVARQGSGNMALASDVSTTTGVDGATLKQDTLDFIFDGTNSIAAGNIDITLAGGGENDDVTVAGGPYTDATTFAAALQAGIDGSTLAGLVTAGVSDDGTRVTLTAETAATTGIAIGAAAAGTTIVTQGVERSVQHLDNKSAVITDIADWIGAGSEDDELTIAVDGNLPQTLVLDWSAAKADDAGIFAGAQPADADELAAGLQWLADNSLAGSGVDFENVGGQITITSRTDGGSVVLADLASAATNLGGVAGDLTSTDATDVTRDGVASTATTGSFNVSDGTDGFAAGTFLSTDVDGDAGDTYAAKAVPLEIVAGVNDTFTISIDGGADTNVTIPPSSGSQTYNTLADLATAIDTAVGAGASVAVDATDPSKLVFSSANATPTNGSIELKDGGTAGTEGAFAISGGARDGELVTEVVSPNALASGDLVMNGTSIQAASALDDTASDETAETSSAAASGIATAAAINKSTEQTGVTATVNATKVVGGDDTVVPTADVGSIGSVYINNVETGTITLTGDASKDRAAAMDAINAVSGQTGVVAEDNGESLTLTASDGRNISVAIDNKAATNLANTATDPNGLDSTNFGASIGLDSSAADDGIGEADITGTGSTYANTAGTTYSTVTLSSANEINIENGVNGADEVQSLGLELGSYGGGESGTYLADMDISTFEGAQEAISAIDNALKTVSSQRAELGALQNRFESTSSNLQITSENLSAANSRIRDADFAAETAELSRTQVLQQAGISILAQANQRPQQVLSLLG